MKLDLSKSSEPTPLDPAASVVAEQASASVGGGAGFSRGASFRVTEDGLLFILTEEDDFRILA